VKSRSNIPVEILISYTSVDLPFRPKYRVGAVCACVRVSVNRLAVGGGGTIEKRVFRI